ncbi:hypothetical protein GCM10027445_31890 [Amycolatopsis endophytica]|uniref:Uncharacterized protein n=1 Tax=Amycolatopsis endophytica TaxID=860233 RepID=A0A853B153_9PSEU|nr:hypothetical protein [Amycolatopsis endophytica]NYI88813.1 hypothetical protein [Amycolatopsis endophytica]
MGGLAGLSLFFGVLLSGMFLKRGNLPLAILFALLAAAPVVVLVVDAIRNRRRSRGTARRIVDPEARRAARLAGAAAVVLGAGAAGATLTWALHVFHAPETRTAAWAASVLLVAVCGVLSAALIVAAVQVLSLAWQGAATVVRIMYLFGLVVGLATLRAISDLGERWPYALGGGAVTGVAIGVIALQKRALRALGGPGRRR